MAEMPDIVFPAGPIFGPDSVVIDSGVDPGSSVDVHVYPDARNPQLKAAGQPTQYYFLPTGVCLAQRQNSPDVDFSMTALVKHAPGRPDLEYVGGSCTFAATLAPPGAVNEGIIDKLMNHNHPDPPARIGALFNYRRGDPAPGLRMVPVTRSAVSCVVEQPQTGTGPILMSAQHSATGSIELAGRNTFLVSCPPAAAAEIVTNLRDGSAPPFVIRNVLTEQFDTGPTTLTANLEIDVDKLYEAFSAVMPPGGPLAGDATAEVIYQAGIAADAIHADLTEAAGGQLDSHARAWMNDTDAIKETVFGMVKEQLFDVSPNESAAPGQSDPAWDSAFGNSKVTLKSDHARTGVLLRQTLTLHGSISAGQTVEGNLNELATVARADLGKYLTVVDIGAF
jgi:hypothetical protein